MYVALTRTPIHQDGYLTDYRSSSANNLHNVVIYDADPLASPPYNVGRLRHRLSCGGYVGGPRYIILSASRLRRQAAPRWCSLISPFRSCTHPPWATRLHLLASRRPPVTIPREEAEIVKHFAFRRMQCPMLLFIILGVSDATFDTNVKPIPPIPPYILFLSNL